MAVKPTPDGYPTVCPYLIIGGAADAIDFYTTVLGAKERMRLAAPEGKIGHAELEVGSSVVMLGDEVPGMGHTSPKSIGGTPVSLSVYVEKVDDVFAKAIQLGAKAISEPQDQFYGDRTGTFEDPWGHQWHVATHIEDLSPDEMQQRAAKAMEGMGT